MLWADGDEPNIPQGAAIAILLQAPRADAHVVTLAQSVPELTIVVDHVGGPLGYAGYAGRHDEVRAAWRKSMAELAKRPNIVVKVGGLGMAMGWSAALLDAFAMVVILNISLGVFNLVPIPPLDGSKVLFALLPANSRAAYSFMALLERYGLILIFAFLFFGGSFIYPVVAWIFGLLVG